MAEDRHDPNTLADQLDVLLPPGRFDTPAGDDNRLLDAAVRLAVVPQPPALSADAKARIQLQVINAYRQQARPMPRFKRVSMMRWAAVVGVILVLLVVLTPPTLASVPGDVLYPVKQSIEQAELALATTHEAQAAVLLTHAERRIQEALTLLERGSWNRELLTATLDDMVAAAQSARAGAPLPTARQVQLEARTAQVYTLLDSTLSQAEQSGLASQEALTALTARVQEAQDNGALLLPDAIGPTTVPSPTPVATETPSPEVTAKALDITATSTPSTAQMMPAMTLEATGEAGGNALVVIEGPIQAIDGNHITVFDIDITVEPANPILTLIQVGDVIHVEGNFVSDKFVAVMVGNIFGNPPGGASVALDGPVQAINANIVTIDNISVLFDPGDSVLASLHTGEVLHVEGDFHHEGDVFILVVVNVVIINNIDINTDCRRSAMGMLICDSGMGSAMGS